MLELDFTIIHKRATPLIQAAVSLAIGWAGMLFCRVLGRHSGEEYFAALIALIFFSIINAVISIAYRSYLRYTLPSLYLYVLLTVILFLSAKFLSGTSIWKPQMREYRMMFISVSIFYLLISNLVRVVRAIYNAIEKEM